MAAIDYYEVQANVAGLLNNLGFRHVFIEGMEREVANIAHMPLANVRLQEAQSEIITIPGGYYENIVLLVDIIAFDLGLFKEAATLRGSLLRGARQAILDNRTTVPSLNTMKLGGTTFGAAAGENGGHVAMATFTVICEAYVD